MNTLRTAAQQALDFIVVTNKSSQFWSVPSSNLNKTVQVLRAALAEPAAALTVEEAISALVTALAESKGWLRDYSDGCIRDAIDRKEPRSPLPASEIVTMYDENPRGDSDMIAFARAIEAAHGIGEPRNE